PVGVAVGEERTPAPLGRAGHVGTEIVTSGTPSPSVSLTPTLGAEGSACFSRTTTFTLAQSRLLLTASRAAGAAAARWASALLASPRSISSRANFRLASAVASSRGAQVSPPCSRAVLI